MIDIDLKGPRGNSYCLLGQARSLCKDLDMNSKPILDDMKSGDYEHLLEVFEKHFSEYVTLNR